MLQASDLTDGLRMLVLQEGRFWPAKLIETALDGVYSVDIERTRRAQPVIMARDDILRDAVRKT